MCIWRVWIFTALAAAISIIVDCSSVSAFVSSTFHHVQRQQHHQQYLSEDRRCFQAEAGRIESSCGGARFGGSGHMRGGSTTQLHGKLSWRHRRGGGGDVSARLAPIDHGITDEVTAVDTEAPSSFTPLDQDHNKKNRRDKRGILWLATVPLVWGTYAPSVKYLYDAGGDSVASPPGLVFNFGCYLVSAMTLAGVAWFNHVRRPTGGPKPDAVAPKATAQANRYAALAGLELGGWLFIGSTMQVWGLELTTASRAAFLVQLTTVIVPVLEALLGRRKLKSQVWIACALATVGVALVSLGGMLLPGTNAFEYIVGCFSPAAKAAVPSGILGSVVAPGNLRGDLLVALSALFYSLHVMRLGVHVSKVETLALARAKAVAELGYAAVSLAAAAFWGGQAQVFARFAASLVSRLDILLVFGVVVVWNGAVTTAYAMWAQTRGQAVVAPSEANLVYSMQPLWSTLFAVVFLKETFGATESLGAAIVLGALFLATQSNDGAASKDSTPVQGVVQEDSIDIGR